MMKVLSKYVCDISDNDFAKVQNIYENESRKNTFDVVPNPVENTLSIFAIVLLAFGLVAFIGLWVAASHANPFHFEWYLFAIGIGVLINSMVSWAFIRVFINISIKLDKIGE